MDRARGRDSPTRPDRPQPADERPPHVFERFWRGHGARGTSASGIGLAVAAESDRHPRTGLDQRQWGQDRIYGLDGDDTIVGGAGQDLISAGAGDDRTEARDGEADFVFCGVGNDTVIADAIDHITRAECEVVEH